MSVEPENIDPEARHEELKERALSKIEEEEEQHNAIIQAAKNGVEATIEESEWVELSDARIEVATDVSGKTMKRLGEAEALAADKSPYATSEAYQANLEALCDITITIETENPMTGETLVIESDEQIRLYWDSYIEECKLGKIKDVLKALTKPIEEEHKRKQEAMESFPGDEKGRRSRRAREFRT